MPTIYAVPEGHVVQVQSYVRTCGCIGREAIDLTAMQLLAVDGKTCPECIRVCIPVETAQLSLFPDALISVHPVATS